MGTSPGTEGATGTHGRTNHMKTEGGNLMFKDLPTLKQNSNDREV